MLFIDSNKSAENFCTFALLKRFLLFVTFLSLSLFLFLSLYM